MPLCTFEGNASLFSSTPVENLFLQELMLRAPGDYVKVYLYGLMQAHYPSLAEKDLNKFAASLGLERKELDKALSYWQKRGLLYVERNGTLRYNNVRNALFGGRVAGDGSHLYEFAAFSNRLDEIAKEYKREWKKNEPAMLYDLLEDGFEEESLFLLLKDVVRRLGKNLTNARLNALTKEWRQKNLRTAAAAREEILGVTLRDSSANAVLVKMGITQRKVSEAEHLLYEKWTKEWGFSDSAIFLIVQEMTGVQSPNFKYLDKKLASTKELKDTTASGLSARRKQLDGENEKIRPIAYALGARGSVTDSWRRYYRRWTQEYNLSQEMLLEAAADLNAQGVNTFKEAETRIAALAQQGLLQKDDLNRYHTAEGIAQTMRDHMGLAGKPTASECNNVLKWLESMPEELLIFAADCSSGARKPLGYAMRILGDWQRGGICTLAAAQEERDKTRKTYEGKNGKPSTVAYEGQRQYDNERDTLFDDLEG